MKIINFIYLSFMLIHISLFNETFQNQKLKLITVLYNETNSERMKEYITCLEYNLVHPSIDHIHVLYDTVRDDTTNELLSYLKRKKVTISFIQGRPSFVYCFKLANEMFPNAKIILTNADIYFNDTLKVLENYNLTGQFLAITRKEVAVDGTISYMRKTEPYIGRREGSQDVWIFQTPLPLFKREDIKLGTLHCEGEVAYQLIKLGLKVINPFFSIDCFHVHLSGIRHYADRPIPWPYFVELPLNKLPVN
jgi:hypothetical protein